MIYSMVIHVGTCWNAFSAHVFFISFIIPDDRVLLSTILILQPTAGLIGGQKVTFINKMLYCNFTRTAKQKFESTKYDMANNKYYLIMVKGPIQVGRLCQ